MMGETELFGVYLNAELMTSMLALIFTWAFHRLLVWLGFHRHIWHLALFETALFFIVWGAVLVAIKHTLPGATA
jgi:protein AaeX